MVGTKRHRKSHVTPRTKGARTNGTQSIDRALDVLSSFISTPEQGITDLANSTGLSPSTVHRMLQALVNAGFVEQDPTSERYRLGPTAVVLGHSARESLGLERALPILERLGGETGESVNLGVRDGFEVVVVLRVESVQPLRLEQPPGSRIAIHASSIGKSMLAFGDDSLDGMEMGRFTPATIGTKKALRKELTSIREFGYSIDREESIPGVTCLGAPILNTDGVAVAGIAIQAPTVRLTAERQEHLSRRLLATSAEITDLLFPQAPTDDG